MQEKAYMASKRHVYIYGGCSMKESLSFFFRVVRDSKSLALCALRNRHQCVKCVGQPTSVQCTYRVQRVGVLCNYCVV